MPVMGVIGLFGRESCWNIFAEGSAEITEKKGDLPEMQNSSFVKYSVQKWDTVDMSRPIMSHRAHNLCQKFCPRQMMRSLFTSNRPTVRQQFGNNVICSTHNPFHLIPWDGGLKTVSLYQFLSLFLQVPMHVLTSTSVFAQRNVHGLVPNADCFVYHAQKHAENVVILTI